MDFRVWLVIADEARAQAWQRLLLKAGWPMTVLRDPAALTREAAAGPGLALLDAAALGPRPAAGVRELKAKALSLPILLVSARQLPDETLIDVFAAGADDYFPDTMDERLVLAKLNAHLRRVLPQVAGSLESVLAPGGDIKLDRRARTVSVKGGGGRWVVTSELTPTEARMLSLFLERPGMVLERRFLLESVWQGEAEVVQSGTVDKHVEALRRKLGPKGRRIRTVYGSGYLFKDDEP